MPYDLLNSSEVLSLAGGEVVIQSRGNTPLAAFLKDVLAKANATEVQLYIGEVHLWDLHLDKMTDSFDRELLDRLNAQGIVIYEKDKIDTRLRLVAIT